MFVSDHILSCIFCQCSRNSAFTRINSKSIWNIWLYIFLENYTINQIWYFNDPILQWTLCFYIVRVGRQLKTNWDILKQSKTKIVKLRQGIRPLHFIGQIFSWIHHPLRPEVSPQFTCSFSALHIQDSPSLPLTMLNQLLRSTSSSPLRTLNLEKISPEPP